MQNVRSSRRILGLFTAFCGLILFAFFQNCSGGFSAVRYEALTATCNAARAPFDKEKVPDELANENLPGHPADGVTVPKETPVLAVLDNSCRRLREQAGQIEGWIAPEEISIPDIRYQSFSIILPRDFALTELRNIADQDKCVLGLRVNRAFELHSVANDPLMTRQAPDLNSMQAAAAYDMLFPGGAELAQRAVVAVVDSGIRYYDPAYSADLRNYNIEIYHSHPDLQDVFWRDDSGFVGFNFGTELEVFRKYPIDMGSVYRSPTTGQVERTFHGTHVAGIIAASSGNGVGISGVAHNSAVIMPVRVTTDKVLRAAGYDTGSTSSLSILYNAIQYAVEPAGKANGRIADVINISMGSSPIPKSQMFNGIDSVLRSALNLAVSKNASVAVAAGNSNVDLKDYFVQPASLGSTIDGVVTVGSLDTSNMRRSSFSNYGITQVEITAPGSNILSTINEDEDDPLRPNDPRNTVGYGILSGTSMASPQVAGAMALAVAYLRSHNISYSPADIESLIVNSAERTEGYVGIGTSDGARNRGRLDLKNLATALMARNAASTGVMAKASPEALHEAAVKREAASVSLFDCP